jgi:predicted DNA-binding protein
MPHVLTVKISHPLLDRLEKVCSHEGKSKGAMIREAVEKLLEEKSEKEGSLMRIRKITEAHIKGKKVKIRADWEEIYRQARVPMDLTPEEEVRRGRLRGMIFK